MKDTKRFRSVVRFCGSALSIALLLCATQCGGGAFGTPTSNCPGTAAQVVACMGTDECKAARPICSTAAPTCVNGQCAFVLAAGTACPCMEHQSRACIGGGQELCARQTDTSTTWCGCH